MSLAETDSYRSIEARTERWRERCMDMSWHSRGENKMVVWKIDQRIRDCRERIDLSMMPSVSDST